MSSSSDSETYEELGDFIVDEEPIEESNSQDESNEPDLANDRIRSLTTTLQPNQTPAQKLLRAHIAVLCSALGGPDHTSNITPPPYKLGHDALACLKDIKRWIRAVDERQNNYAVALACADSGLVKDLIVIMCQFDKNKTGIKVEKIRLACLELLVLLTWPVEFGAELSESQQLLFTEVRKVQVGYKKLILSYLNGAVLKSVIRLVLPVIKKSRLDREPRENQILKLVLYLVRNVVAIVPANASVSSKSSHRATVVADDLPNGVSPDDISINNMVSVFEKNKVLMLLLTISGSIGTEFDKDMFGEICLECIYLLVKGLSVSELLEKPTPKDPTNPSQPLQSVSTTAGMELQDLLALETKRKQSQTATVSTRHGRFGSLLSIKAPDSNPYVVSGQEALFTTSSTLTKLDKSKTWKNRTLFKYDSDEYVISRYPVYLTTTGRDILHEFVKSFLSGGCFNNLIETMSSRLTTISDMTVVDEYTKASYFFTISWFLSYEKQSIKLQQAQDYGSVGAALSSVNFILLTSYFRDSFGSKSWNSLHVAMLCFRELIQISNSLFGKQDADETDRDLAEGIIRKLFSFSDFVNIIAQIPQTAAKHSPAYLGVVVSVVNTLLESFETFANEDVELYIQSRRKKSKFKRNTERHPEALQDVIDASDDEQDAATAKEITKERKLDFKLTEARFFHTSIVNAYIAYLSRYDDLDALQIKICFKYFHRLFVVRKDFTGLYRLDFMQLLERLHHDLRGSSRARVDEFIYYFMKKFKIALERFPMPIELLFPRMEDLSCKIYLATGELYTKPEPNTRGPRLAKQLEFVREFNRDEQIKILVSALKREDKLALLVWIISELERILSERILDDSSIAELNPGVHRRLFINNGNLRLLLKLIGFDLPFAMDENPELPTSVENATLTEFIDLIKKWKDQHGEFDDGKEPSFFLRAREDDEEEDYGEDDDIAFETAPGSGERMNIHELDALDELEQSLSQRSKGHARKKRPQRVHEHHRTSGERQRLPPVTRTFNSAEFVHDSDDESDDEKDAEFFAREERLRTLLGESGGIVDGRQLTEFKLRWAEIEKNGGVLPERRVDTSELFVNDDDDDDDIMSDAPQSSTDSSKRSADEEEEEEKQEVAPAKRLADDDDDEEIAHVKRKRIVVSDDEDE